MVRSVMTAATSTQLGGTGRRRLCGGEEDLDAHKTVLTCKRYHHPPNTHIHVCTLIQIYMYM